MTVSETDQLSGPRHDKGIDSYLSVLGAQVARYGVQKSPGSLCLARLANNVRLCAVLGGGWEVEPSVNLAAESGSSPELNQN